MISQCYLSKASSSSSVACFCSCSEQSVVLKSLELIVILTDSLIHVVRVCDILSVLDLVGLSVALAKDFLAGDLIALHHFDGEDVVDLNIVSRQSVVQEVRGEHHVVALEPELWVVLVVELHDIT